MLCFQAFWLLDHEDWEEGVSMMLDPLLQVSFNLEHHRLILKLDFVFIIEVEP